MAPLTFNSPFQLMRRLAWKLAPRALRDKINPPYASISYSQEGEDRLLARIFISEGQGFYVDVGAHHPFRYSNTHIFYLMGWRGMNIDPNPDAMELFRQARPRDINLNLGISDSKVPLTYYEFNEPALNGFSERFALSADGVSHYRIVNRRQISTVPLAKVLDEYLPVGQTIDFLNVDVEGLDESVLNSNDWNKYRPRVILAEDLKFASLMRADASPVTRFLIEKGYDLFAKTVNTLIFVRGDGFAPPKHNTVHRA